MIKFFATLLVLIASASIAHADPVMDRINKSQTIRCGFVSYSPGSMKDTATGKMAGYNVDIIEEAARRMGLKVEWAHETNWPTIATDLQTNKFDVACAAYWMNPKSSLQMLSSDPVFYQPLFFAVRADDTRFDKTLPKSMIPPSVFPCWKGMALPKSSRIYTPIPKWCLWAKTLASPRSITKWRPSERT